jgi:hypothetical protein
VAQPSDAFLQGAGQGATLVVGKMVWQSRSSHSQVGGRGNLGFSNLRMSKLATADSGDVSDDNVVQALAIWPTVSGEPGAVVRPVHIEQLGPCMHTVSLALQAAHAGGAAHALEMRCTVD